MFTVQVQIVQTAGHQLDVFAVALRDALHKSVQMIPSIGLATTGDMARISRRRRAATGQRKLA